MDPRTLVFAFPYAGGASYSFAPLARSCRTLEVRAVEYPGHGQRLAEPLVRSVPDLAEAVFAEVEAAARASRPYTLFGHSMGGSVAWSVACKLFDGGLPPPRYLVLSAARPPWAGERPRTFTLPDAEFLSRVAELGSGGMEALNEPELRKLLLPMLKADFEAIETFDAAPRAIGDLPVVSLFGSRDPHVGPEHADEWRRVTTGPFQRVGIPGGHFFPFEDPVRTVAELLERLHAGR